MTVRELLPHVDLSQGVGVLRVRSPLWSADTYMVLLCVWIAGELVPVPRFSLFSRAAQARIGAPTPQRATLSAIMLEAELRSHGWARSTRQTRSPPAGRPAAPAACRWAHTTLRRHRTPHGAG